MNILICDDDPYTTKALEKLISELTYVNELIVANSGQALLGQMKNTKFDVAFLDIDMPEMDGLLLGKTLKSIQEDMEIVYVTAYKNYAFEAFSVKPYDYILKPIDYDEIYKILENLYERSQKKSNLPKNMLMVKEKQNYFMIDLQHLYFIEKDQKNLVFHCKDQTHTTRGQFQDIEEKLNGDFLRSHKSYIVNLKKIYSIEPFGDTSYTVYFKDFKPEKNALITKDKIHLLR
jgi:two-component system LytT family response regulator